MNKGKRKYLGKTLNDYGNYEKNDISFALSFPLVFLFLEIYAGFNMTFIQQIRFVLPSIILVSVSGPCVETSCVF